MSDRTSAAVPSQPAPDPLLGRTVNDRFTIKALIARGGMGKVYRAEQAPLGRVCALKVLNPNYSGEADPEFHRRFFLEASTSSRLTHPNTVTVFDYGRTEDDIYYMAMEYLEGRTLHRAIREAGSLPEERGLHIARQVCRSLREAHALGVIHRDLKPANIFLMEHGDESDFVKVLDFGLVKNMADKPEDQLTQTGLFMGSPKYMAPEQIQGLAVDGRTDIYSLGIILYEMFTGRVPFDRTTSVSILMAHVNEPPPPMRGVKHDMVLSQQAEDIVMRCLAKDPAHRFASMDELLLALKHASSSGGQVQMTGAYGAYASGSMPAYDSMRPMSVTSAPPPAVISAPPPLFSSATPMPLASADISMETGAQPGNSRTWLPFAVLAAVFVGALTGLIAFRVTSPPPPTPAQLAPTTAIPSAHPKEPELKAPAPSAAPAPQALKWKVTSDPEGASVRDDGVEVCTATPCELTYSGEAADPSKPKHLSFSKGGYKSEQKDLLPKDGPAKVKLLRLLKAPKGNTAGTADPAPTPNGFKDVPY